MNTPDAFAYRFGIEEEYFLADAETGHSPSEAAAQHFHDAVEAAIPSASRELLIGQVETQTPPETDFNAAHRQLRQLRRDIARHAEDAGLLLFAAGSHPLARPQDQHVTQKTRYKRLASKVGAMAERVIVCAMHVHVEVPETACRIDVMNRAVPFLPLFLALSQSSPFWEGEKTGLAGFRLAAFAEWPHMGVPTHFSDMAEYERFVKVLVDARVVPDGSYIWWLIRPSARFPTLEIRICDSCTRAEDAVAIAALYRSLICALSRRRDLNAGVGPIHWGVTNENIWQVQHLGLAARLIDCVGLGTVSVRDKLEATIALVADETEALGSTAWVAKTRDILDRGTSSDRQLALVEKTLAGGADHDAALRIVTRALADETLL